MRRLLACGTGTSTVCFMMRSASMACGTGAVDDLLHGALGFAVLGEDDLDRLGLGTDAARPVCAVCCRRDSAPDGEQLVSPSCPQTSFTSASSRAHVLELVIVACNESHRVPLGIRTQVSSRKMATCLVETPTNKTILKGTMSMMTTMTTVLHRDLEKDWSISPFSTVQFAYIQGVR